MMGSWAYFAKVFAGQIVGGSLTPQTASAAMFLSPRRPRTTPQRRLAARDGVPTVIAPSFPAPGRFDL